MSRSGAEARDSGTEELGLVIEVDATDEKAVIDAFRLANVPCLAIGCTTNDYHVRIRYDGRMVLDDGMRSLRDLWEATSFQLDRRQAGDRRTDLDPGPCRSPQPPCPLRD